ncbi:hypothetical protein SNE40_002814 [Patella caerulea]|uniref:HAT C-terminal dimerisation domain-containing protein n=1 Tax=Patella caerulea TaxID=87958 RepID=A0AAN8K8I7_PATCE
MEPNEVRISCDRLAQTYVDDITTDIGDEMIQFRHIVMNADMDEQKSEHAFYKLLLRLDIQDTLPNIEAILRIYLCMMISNCSGERSFSKLKLVKNYLRSTMGQDRLVYLVRLASESYILRTINVKETIAKFVRGKKRRVFIH